MFWSLFERLLTVRPQISFNLRKHKTDTETETENETEPKKSLNFENGAYGRGQIDEHDRSWPLFATFCTETKEEKQTFSCSSKSSIKMRRQSFNACAAYPPFTLKISEKKTIPEEVFK